MAVKLINFVMVNIIRNIYKFVVTNLVLGGLTANLTLLIISILWLIITFWNFNLPGLYVDEVNHYAFAPGILSEQAAKLHHYRLADNIIDQQDNISQFPILGGSIYNTTIRTYIALPFFQTIGFSAEALRLFSSLAGLATIISIITLIGRIFGWTAAILLGLAVVTDPISSFSLRAQGGAFWFVTFFSTLCAHVLIEASNRVSPPHWMAAAAGVLLALTVHSYFVGYFIAFPLMVCGLCIFWRGRKTIITFLGVGFITYSPFLYALASIYIQTPGALSSYGIPAFAQKSALPIISLLNLERFIDLLNGAIGSFSFTRALVGNFITPFSEVRWVIVFVGLVSVIIFCLRSEGVQKKFLLCITTIGIIYTFSLFCFKGTNTHHAIPLVILLYMVISSGTTAPFLLRYILVGVMALFIATNIISLSWAHQSLEKTGGVGYHNESYNVPAYLFRNSLKDYHPIFSSWGHHLQFLFQTKGSIPYSFISARYPDRINAAIKEFGKVAIIVNQKDFPIEGIDKHDIKSALQFSQRNGPSLFYILLIEH